MPYNLSIPGQVSLHQLQAIEAVARLVPPHGKVVEVGSLFGSSSWAWAKSVDPTVTVYCMDPWTKNLGVRSMEIRHGITYGIEQFKAYTADCPNIQPMQGYSPSDFLNWSDPIDLYYEDAVHVDPILGQNLAFWSGKLKSSGIICGDDFRPRFPDVQRGARELAEKFGRTLIRVDFFWCLLPDEGQLPGSHKAADRLRELGRQSDALKQKRGPAFSFGPRQSIDATQLGQSPMVPCRLANDSMEKWPPTSGDPLWVGTRIVDDPKPDAILAENRVPLGISQIEADVPLDFDLEMPTAALKPGRYRAIFDILSPKGAWTIYPKIGRAGGVVFEVKENVDPASLPGSGGAPKSNPAYSFGTKVDFAKGGLSHLYTRDGWVLPEARHRWMSGVESRLSLWANRPSDALLDAALVRLTIGARPFVVPGKLDQQTLEISVNGEQVFSGQFSEQTLIDFSFPARVFFSKQPADIVLLHPNAGRPCDLIDGSADQKYLSFAVSNIVLDLMPQ